MKSLLTIVSAAVVALAAATIVSLAVAQSYPAKPVKLLIPFPAGGNTDVLGRLMAQKLTESLGQQVFVENRGGAGGVIGAEAAAKSPADGYTIFFGTTGALASQPALQPKLSYDPIQSFAPISALASAPVVVIVNSSMPVSTLKEFIDYARARPGKINYGSAGIGHFLHVAGEAFNVAADVKLFHVPYKGTSQIIADLFGERLDVMIDTIVAYTEHVRSGKLKALAVGNRTRLSRMPDIPTTAEAGLPGFEFASYFGLLAPAGTPGDIVRRLNADVVKALGTPEINDAVAKMGLEPIPGTPEQYAALIADDSAKWRRIVSQIGIKLE
ncbi:MAG: Bug family tripartite tricarboxylate transporter substrate binding protein [Burkholderiales bacterium]